MSVRVERATVAVVSPLSIYIGGTSSPVSALGIAGQSLSASDPGIALVLPGGARPIFLKTA